MEGRLFGTDGVRGVANVDLTPCLITRLGSAAGSVLYPGVAAGRPRILVGWDTRASADLLVSALTAGLLSAGVDVSHLGVIPTPGVAFAAASGSVPGAVISASHNPAQDNGIKFFGRDGFKIDEETEAAIEAQMGAEPPAPAGAGVGRISEPGNGGIDYVEHLAAAPARSLAGLRFVLDCANGAAYRVAPEAFRRAGAEVEALFDSPDGLNINDCCGSTHPDALRVAVAESGADAGFAYDGDADRVIAVDAAGEVVDGDQILGMSALWLQSRGELPGGRIAATVMSNLGLRLAMAEHGVEIVECPVGDKHVIDAMRRESLALGGEQSGHVIFDGHSTTGDGVLTSLMVAAQMAESGRSLAELAGVMTRLPQVLLNVRVAEKAGLERSEALSDAVRQAEDVLAGDGRVLLRPSGTEPLIRIMVEAPTQATADELASRLAEVVRSEFGAGA